MFSHRIEIRNGDSHAIFDYNSKMRINDAQPIKIGNHVWLGADSKVLKGSIIEDGAIISTGAIVTGHVERQAIYAGVPAKKIKENIYWERERL
jgi:acetyltransferase-like isoleucine patch superfamily enzyme